MKLLAIPLTILGFLAAGPAAQAVALTYGGSTIHNHTDDNGKSVVTLNPDYFGGGCCFLSLDPSADFQNAMSKSKAAANWPGLKFDYTGSLNGTFTMDVYTAAHSGDYRGGAQLLLRYNRGDGDPAAGSLLWIQTVTTSAPNGGETIPYPDVYSGANAGSNLPFFYTPTETTLDPNPYVGTANIYSSKYKVNGKGSDLSYDIAFWDWPQRNANATWRGELFLATYDKINSKVKVYDGLNWGFDIASKTPEPATNMLIGSALLLFVWILRRRQRALVS